jgi:putative hydrolases of HD superfamily
MPKYKFNKKYDGIFAQAFIHLFPKDTVKKLLQKIHKLLTPQGVACFTTTKSYESKEGWFPKHDYIGNYTRFRKFWTKEELKETLKENGYDLIDYYEITDPYLKTWMNFTVKKKKVKTKNKSKHLNNLLEFIKFTNAFNEVIRIIPKPQDNILENDTEHSWQLGMTAWYLIDTMSLHYDKNKAMQLAMVHDLVEIYAGDTYIYGDEASINSKKSREEAALEKIKHQFPEFPALHQLISEYEKKESPECIFVYALDKLLPLLNIYLDNGRIWKKKQISLQMLEENKTEKIAMSKDVEKVYKELLNLLHKEKEKLFYENSSRHYQ